MAVLSTTTVLNVAHLCERVVVACVLVGNLHLLVLDLVLLVCFLTGHDYGVG